MDGDSDALYPTHFIFHFQSAVGNYTLGGRSKFPRRRMAASFSGNRRAVRLLQQQLDEVKNVQHVDAFYTRLFPNRVCIRGENHDGAQWAVSK